MKHAGAIIITIAAAVALAGCGTSHSADDKYIGLINSTVGPVHTVSNKESMIKLGHAICTGYDQHLTTLALRNDITNAVGTNGRAFTTDQATHIMAAAVVAYCPNNKARAEAN